MIKPTKLSKEASQFWDAVAAEFDLEEYEFCLLREIVRRKTVVDKLQEAVDKQGVVQVNSQGNRHPHAALAEIRSNLMVMDRYLGRLGLQEDGRIAANQRNAKYNKLYSVRDA
jgi:hypothetical protein